MRAKQVGLVFLQYTAVTVGQALIGLAIQQGTQRVLYELDQRRRRRNAVGFRR